MTPLLPVLLGLAFQAPPSPAPPRFEAGVALVQVDVTVTRDGTPVRGLTAADFEVTDEGVPQALELVLQEDTPVNAWLVLDVSGSVVGEKLAQLRGAGEAFLSRLKDTDRAALLTFSHEVRLRTAIEAAPAAVRAALNSTQAGGATALNDAVYAAATLADPGVGRPVLVVFSDGQDTLSILPPDAVRTVVRETDLVVYGVTLPPDPSRSGINRLPYLTDSRGDRRGAGSDRYGLTAPADDMARLKRVAAEGPSLLRDLAEDSGGRVWNAAGGSQLQDAFTRVVEEVKSRYILRYEPRGVPKSGWHTLQVRLKTGKAEVRARRGYETR